MRKRLGLIVSFLIIIIMFSTFLYRNNNPSITPNDIQIEGVIENNNSGFLNYDEYLLNITMTKKDGSIIIYPYIDGLGNISFNDEDEKSGLFVPGSIGSDGYTETIAIDKLKSLSILEEGSNVSLIGFYFPIQEGKYKANIYLDKLDNFKEIKNPVMICVYTEKKFGKMISWLEIVNIKVAME